NLQGIVATGSVRRKAQLLHRFPRLQIENLRGNVQTRLQKLQDNQWEAAVFAAAGLERIEERPALAIELEWMLPAPAQGAIMIACREGDEQSLNACYEGNDAPTEHCVRIEREFLSTLMGGCSTPISALAKLQEGTIHFRGSILSLDGKVQFDIELQEELSQARNLGRTAAEQLLNQGAKQLVEEIRNLGK